VWDGVKGELLKSLEGHSDEVRTVVWNHDGSRILSGSDDGIPGLENSRELLLKPLIR
jgi:WD40 repeat protein